MLLRNQCFEYKNPVQLFETINNFDLSISAKKQNHRNTICFFFRFHLFEPVYSVPRINKISCECVIVCFVWLWMRFNLEIQTHIGKFRLRDFITLGTISFCIWKIISNKNKSSNSCECTFHFISFCYFLFFTFFILIIKEMGIPRNYKINRRMIEKI